jgi:hypothetical protein
MVTAQDQEPGGCNQVREDSACQNAVDAGAQRSGHGQPDAARRQAPSSRRGIAGLQVCLSSGGAVKGQPIEHACSFRSPVGQEQCWQDRGFNMLASLLEDSMTGFQDRKRKDTKAFGACLLPIRKALYIKPISGPSATQENGSEPSRTLTTLRPPAGFIRACQSDTGLDPPDSADSLSPPSLEALGTLLKSSFVSSIVFHSVREG